MAGALTISTLNNDTGVLATQNGMTGIAKAWLQYNATTQTIVSSFNVSSVTYNGTGDITLNYTTALPSTTYSIVGMGTRIAGSYNSIVAVNGTNLTYTASATRISVIQTNDTVVNVATLNLAVFSS